MSHDSRYETECPHGHGWYFYEDGCAVAGCENAPPTENPWAYYKGFTNEAAMEAWGADRRVAEAKKASVAAPPREPDPPAEMELEAIAALLTSAVSQIGNWRDRARWLFDRGIRIRELGGRAPSAAPPEQREKFLRALDKLLYAHGQWARTKWDDPEQDRNRLADDAAAAQNEVIALYDAVANVGVGGAGPRAPEQIIEIDENGKVTGDTLGIIRDPEGTFE